MKTTIVRVFLALYLPVAALLYLGLLYGPYRQAEALKREIDEIIASETHRTAISETARVRDMQLDGLKEAINRFHAKSQQFATMSVPVFIGRIAKNAQVTLARLEVATAARVSDCTFFKAELDVRGPFANLRAFLTELEENQERFAFVDKARISPVPGTSNYSLVATFGLMLRTMPTEDVLANMGGSAGGPEPPANQQKAGPTEAEAETPSDGAPTHDVNTTPYGS